MHGGEGAIKKVIISIIGFAIAIALVVSVIIPLVSSGKNTGSNAYQLGKQAGIRLEDILK